MKKTGILFIISLFVAIGIAQSQAPRGFAYQAVVRNSNGEVLANQTVTLRISLTNNNASTVYYSESHVATTSGLGIVNLTVGGGQ